MNLTKSNSNLVLIKLYEDFVNESVGSKFQFAFKFTSETVMKVIIAKTVMDTWEIARNRKEKLRAKSVHLVGMVNE